MYKDRHHIIHSRNDWESRPQSRQIREEPSLIVTMSRQLHERIHRECPAIPLLGYYALVRTLRDFEPNPSPLKSMDSLMRAIEGSTEHPRSHPIEKQLGLLAVQAIDLQRPYIREAVEDDRIKSSLVLSTDGILE